MENKEYEAPRLEVYRFAVSTPLMNNNDCPGYCNGYEDPTVCIMDSGGQGSNP